MALPDSVQTNSQATSPKTDISLDTEVKTGYFENRKVRIAFSLLIAGAAVYSLVFAPWLIAIGTTAIAVCAGYKLLSERNIKVIPPENVKPLIHHPDTPCKTTENPKIVPEADPKIVPEADPKIVPEADPKIVPEADPEPLPEADPEPLPKADPEPLPKADPEPLPKADPEPLPKADPEIEEGEEFYDCKENLPSSPPLDPKNAGQPEKASSFLSAVDWFFSSIRDSLATISPFISPSDDKSTPDISVDSKNDSDSEEQLENGGKSNPPLGSSYASRLGNSSKGLMAVPPVDEKLAYNLSIKFESNSKHPSSRSKTKPASTIPVDSGLNSKPGKGESSDNLSTTNSPDNPIEYQDQDRGHTKPESGSPSRTIDPAEPDADPITKPSTTDTGTQFVSENDVNKGSRQTPSSTDSGFSDDTPVTQPSAAEDLMSGGITISANPGNIIGNPTPAGSTGSLPSSTTSPIELKADPITEPNTTKDQPAHNFAPVEDATSITKSSNEQPSETTETPACDNLTDVQQEQAKLMQTMTQLLLQAGIISESQEPKTEEVENGSDDKQEVQPASQTMTDNPTGCVNPIATPSHFGDIKDDLSSSIAKPDTTDEPEVAVAQSLEIGVAEGEPQELNTDNAKCTTDDNKKEISLPDTQNKKDNSPNIADSDMMETNATINHNDEEESDEG